MWTWTNTRRPTRSKVVFKLVCFVHLKNRTTESTSVYVGRSGPFDENCTASAGASNRLYYNTGNKNHKLAPKRFFLGVASAETAARTVLLAFGHFCRWNMSTWTVSLGRNPTGDWLLVRNGYGHFGRATHCERAEKNQRPPKWSSVTIRFPQDPRLIGKS